MDLKGLKLKPESKICQSKIKNNYFKLLYLKLAWEKSVRPL